MFYFYISTTCLEPPKGVPGVGRGQRRLAQDPTGRTVGLYVKELDVSEALPRLYRLRVGEWRAVFAVGPREVIAARIFHRRDGYAWMDRVDEPGVTRPEKG